MKHAHTRANARLSARRLEAQRERKAAEELKQHRATVLERRKSVGISAAIERLEPPPTSTLG